MPRLSLRQYVAVICFAPLAMLGCDIPMPVSGGAPPALPDLSDATVREGELAEGDDTRLGDRFQDEVATVNIPPGATLAVVLDSEAFDPFLTIEIDGIGQDLTNDDFGGSRQRSAIVQTNTAGSTLEARILASSYAAGAVGPYLVRYVVNEPAPLPDARPLADTVEGALTSDTPFVPLTSNNSERRADSYEVALSEGETATVRMESEAFDTYLKVLRDGVYYGRNDDYQGSRSVSQLGLVGPGTYTVLAGAFSASGVGAYTLTTERAGSPERSEPREDTSVPATPIPETLTPEASGARSQSVQGELSDSDTEVPLTANEDSRKADGYSITLEAGQTLDVEMESEAFDTYLKLVLGDAFVARNDDAGSTRRSAFRYRADVSGTYTLYAGTFTAAGRGAYTLTWSIE